MSVQLTAGLVFGLEFLEDEEATYFVLHLGILRFVVGVLKEM